MRTETRLLVLGLAALLGACHQSAGTSPPATRLSGLEVPRFDVLQLASAYQTEENAILEAVNAFRAKHGLSTLTEAADLSRLSRAHATDMATRGYFNHTNPEGQGPYQRLMAANIPFTAYGATNSYPSQKAHVVIADWEAHHGKHYMLDPRFTEAGVGVARTADGKFRVTATYIRP